MGDHIKSILKARNECSRYPACECNLCPIDPEVSQRSWIAEADLMEPICPAQKFRRHPIVKAQRHIERLIRGGKRKSLLGRPLEGHWYGAELLEVARHLEERRRRASERRKQLIAEGKVKAPHEWVRSNG